ncbi:MAG: hypothetical protein V4793_03240 [Paraburkholderia tropica]|uniref:hypothetical protein n=1 Tax=Burkholderia gladioli TaxID=28095 RepID=UPI001642309F|nr:hypothetical protein [Burkholderia gladioli]
MKHQRIRSKILLAALTGVTSATVAAVPPVAPQTSSAIQLSVGGVISPGSCTIAQGPLAFDMKAINAASLSKKDETPIAPLSSKLSITCGSANASFTLSVSNTNKSSTVPVTTQLTHAGTGIKADQAYVYDLFNPAEGNKRIGRYAFQFRDFTYKKMGEGETRQKALVVTSADKVTWANGADTDANSGQLKNDGSTYVSFADKAATGTPVRANSFEGNIVVGAVIRPTSEFSTANELSFEGSATITLTYL